MNEEKTVEQPAAGRLEPLVGHAKWLTIQQAMNLLPLWSSVLVKSNRFEGRSHELSVEFWCGEKSVDRYHESSVFALLANPIGLPNEPR